jgi:hypothetical protein
MGDPMTDQSMPNGGGAAGTPVARELFLTMLLEREQRGIATYGRSLHAHNGRDAIRDALEELIDCWQYLVQARIERDARLAEIARLDDEIASLATEIERLKGGQS